MNAETKRIRVRKRVLVGKRVHAVRPAIIDKMGLLIVPEQELREEQPLHEGINEMRLSDKKTISNIEGVEELEFQHLGRFVGVMTLIPILINVFSVIFH
jgi:hypothetical protein